MLCVIVDMEGVMNLGYMNHNELGMEDVNCPLCGSNIYMNKYGSDFRCMNENCAAHMNAGKLIRVLKEFIVAYNEGSVWGGGDES